MKGVKIMLSRKYYRMLARVINNATIKESGKMLPVINKSWLVGELCNELQNDNSYFCGNKFRDACGD